jgi:hypothetical protein
MKKSDWLLLALHSDIRLLNMASFTIIESAVKSGLTTYKAIVEQLCQQNADLAATLLEQVSLKENDPKILRKKHRAEQVEKFGKDDKESINAAMKEYDVSFRKANPDAKPKRAPPVRKWTEEDKAFTKAKNAYLKVEKAKLSDSLTVAEMKKQVKALGDAYTKAHKKPESEEQSDSEEELVVEEQSDSEEELVVEEPEEPKVTDAKLDKVAEKARKQAKKEENERKRAAKEAKAAKKAGSV